MRRFSKSFLLATLAALSFSLSPAHAVENDQISDYEVTATINADGTVTFFEELIYEFGTNDEHHGIYRTLPFQDELPSDKLRVYEVQMDKVMQDGKEVPFEVSEEGNYQRYQIGNPDETVSGRHVYQLQYTYKGALGRITQDDLANDPNLQVGDVDFYWDLIGFDWEVPIKQAWAQVVVPGETRAAKCTFGEVGSTDTCQSSKDLQYSVSSELGLGRGMTVSVQMPIEGFTGNPQPKIIDNPGPKFSDFTKSLPFGLVPGLVISVGLVLWARRSAALVKTAPVTDFVRFETPKGLSVGLAAVGFLKGFNSKTFAAVLLDLTVRRAISLTESGRKKLTVTRLTGDVKLEAWESQLLDTLFSGEESVELKSRSNSLRTQVNRLTKNLTEVAINQGLRNRAELKPRIPFVAIAIVSTVLTFASFGLIANLSVFGVLLPAFLLIAVGAFIAIFRIPKVQTAESAEFLSSMHGLRRALDTDAAAARREFAIRTKLQPGAIFATLLPWAIIFDLQDSWSDAFPDLTEQDLAMTGLGYLSIAHVNSLVSTASSAAASAMSSSSGSGGGSAGGGGGGGGGGSW